MQRLRSCLLRNETQVQQERVRFSIRSKQKEHTDFTADLDRTFGRIVHSLRLFGIGAQRWHLKINVPINLEERGEKRVVQA